MFKYTAVFVLTSTLVVSAPTNSASVAGAWQVDYRHSDAQLVTDATTEYGKTKLNTTLGFARVAGRVRLDQGDSKDSRIDFTIYPATSMTRPIDEDGKLQSQWLENLSNHTLVCFHSKSLVRTSDGKLQATGTLVLTRVDRNVDATPSEAYAGPVYGPPVIHRVTRDATFVFDSPADAKSAKDGSAVLSGSTSVYREDFPQLLRAVVSTYWPPVVQDKQCQPPASVGEDYHGIPCTGTFLEAPSLPEAPRAANDEDYPGPSNYNAVVGNRLTIMVHLRLMPRT